MGKKRLRSSWVDLKNDNLSLLVFLFKYMVKNLIANNFFLLMMIVIDLCYLFEFFFLFSFLSKLQTCPLSIWND